MGNQPTEPKTKTPTFNLEKFNASQLPELATKQAEIDAVIKANEVIDITDTATYEVMKKSRTAVKTLRTGLQKEKTSVLSRLKEVIIKGTESKYDEIIGAVTAEEDLRQAKVDVWEDQKKKEKEEAERIENLRIETAKNSINTFYDAWSKNISELKFEDIETTTEILSLQVDNFDRASLKEFSVLFDQKAEMLREKLVEKTGLLNDAEHNRLTQLRLDEERAEEARKQKHRDGIAEFNSRWISAIVGMTAENMDAVLATWNLKEILDFEEYQSVHTQNLHELKTQLNEKMTFIKAQQKQIAEQDQLEKEKFAFRTEKRIKQLTDLGLKQNSGGVYVDDKLIFGVIATDITDLDDEDFENLIVKAKIALAPPQEEDKIHDQIGSDPIIEIEPVQIIDEENPPLFDKESVDNQVTKNIIFNTIEDLMSDFLYYDRKESETLPTGAIEKALRDKVITTDEMKQRFSEIIDKIEF